MSKAVNYKRIGQHLLFWVLFVVYQLTESISGRNLVGDYWWGDFSILHLIVTGVLMQAILAYVLVYIIVPKFLDTKKYLHFGVVSLLWIYIIGAVHIALYFYYFEKIYTVFMWIEKGVSVPIGTRLTHVGFLFSHLSFLVIPAIILGAIKFYKTQLTYSKIEEEKNMMELKALKNQLNPHFLFNTLNNLYSYVVTGSPKAADMVLKLSGILDYVLYKSQQSHVPLAYEIESIENFIGLEKIRYGDRLEVNYNSSGNMEAKVSPLIIMSIVENAFKHGASGDTNLPKIDIDIKEQDGIINCRVWNTKSDEKGELNDAYKVGIGLSNIKRQLHLLYPNQHNLIVDDQSDTFTIQLTLKAPA